MSFGPAQDKLPRKLVFVDTETTGGSAIYGRVIEIGIVRVEDGKVVEKFESLINPQTHLPEEISSLTGITTQDLENAPTFYAIHKELQRILKDCVFVAHNVRFDYSFLKNEFKRLDLEFSPKQFCTVKLSRSLTPQFNHHNLDALIERYGLECNRRHRALDDADAIWQFYQKIQQQIDKETFTIALDKALKKPAFPINLTQQELDTLPESPGVYIFYGENNLPLYIGKSINIRQRVKNHFSSDHLSGIEMKISQQVQRIKTIETAGELGALLKESELVKQMQPMYNRKLRNASKLTVLKSVKNESGYEVVVIGDSSLIEVETLDQVIGVFKSKKQVKEFLQEMVKIHSLCDKLTSLENCKSQCFGYGLLRCKGACIGEENVLKYNLRFQEAFYHSKISRWPFESAIVIEEKDELKNKKEYFILDKWCYLGQITPDNQIPTSESQKVFDLDVYKIVKSFLRNPKNQKQIISSSHLSELIRL